MLEVIFIGCSFSDTFGSPYNFEVENGVQNRLSFPYETVLRSLKRSFLDGNDLILVCVLSAFHYWLKQAGLHAKLKKADIKKVVENRLQAENRIPISDFEGKGAKVSNESLTNFAILVYFGAAGAAASEKE